MSRLFTAAHTPWSADNGHRNGLEGGIEARPPGELPAADLADHEEIRRRLLHLMEAHERGCAEWLNHRDQLSPEERDLLECAERNMGEHCCHCTRSATWPGSRPLIAVLLHAARDDAAMQGMFKNAWQYDQTTLQEADIPATVRTRRFVPRLSGCGEGLVCPDCGFDHTDDVVVKEVLGSVLTSSGLVRGDTSPQPHTLYHPAKSHNTHVPLTAQVL